MVGRLFNKIYVFWLILALPGFLMLNGLLSGNADMHGLLHPTGEFATRFTIIAMMISPFCLIFPTKAWPRWMMRRRRALGVAAFVYALVHTVFYIIDSGSWQKLVDELPQAGIWTGWLAMLIFLPLGLTSNDWSLRYLKAGWKKLQNWVYPAAVLILLHWLWLEGNYGPALVHFTPLALLEAWRFYKIRQQRQTRTAETV